MNDRYAAFLKFIQPPSEKGFTYDTNKNLSGFRNGDYYLRITNAAEVRPILTEHHYSKKMPKNSKYHFAVEYKGETHGAITIGHGIRPDIKTSFGCLKKGEVLEFDRMWLSDIPPKNSESIVISMLVKILRQLDRNLRWLISYADGTVGNTGIIYKASNFKELPSIKADFYILENGERVHPVSMYHRHKTRVWAFLQKEYPNIRKAQGRQYRFILRV
jgi:hypothetical protein